MCGIVVHTLLAANATEHFSYHKLTVGKNPDIIYLPFVVTAGIAIHCSPFSHVPRKQKWSSPNTFHIPTNFTYSFPTLRRLDSKERKKTADLK